MLGGKACMPKGKLMFMLVFAFLLSSCGPSKQEVLDTLVAKNEGALIMHVFADKSVSYKVNEVHNSEPKLLARIQQVVIHSDSKDESYNRLKKIGIEAEWPVILIFDTEKVIFQTGDPEKLREFAKTLGQ